MTTLEKPKMKTVRLPAGESIAALGLGTWGYGERPSNRHEEIATIRLALDQGANVIDTAEMYGDGKAEELIGEALEGRRDQAFIVSKVLPQHASYSDCQVACERSLERLRTDRIDLYLLHWRGEIPLAETVEAFMVLQHAGKIRHFGVSNFDITDMSELWSVPGGDYAQTNQVLYNLARRGIEWDLLPWMRQRGLPLMAYSPLNHSAVLELPGLLTFCRRHHLTPAQAALSWLLEQKDVMAIPKTGSRKRLKEDLGALTIHLTRQQLNEMDALFPPPKGPVPLQMI